MLNKNLITLIAILGLPLSIAGMGRMTRQQAATPENFLAGKLVELLDEALDKNKYNEEFCWKDFDSDKKVSLTIQQYPQKLLPSSQRTKTPTAAMDLYTEGIFAAVNPTSVNSADEEEVDGILVDGTAPLLLQHHASHHKKPRMPILIKVSITGWHDLTTLSFLQDPQIDIIEYSGFDLFKTCLADLTVQDCGIATLDRTTFAEYPNLLFLDLSRNNIRSLHHPAITTETMWPLMSLHYLNLADNCIRTLGDFFTKDFQWVNVLDLSSNQLQAIPAESLRGLITISNINFSNNLLRNSGLVKKSFKGVASASRFFNLMIYLDGNVLTAFPPLGDAASHLLQLSLNGNPLLSCQPDDNCPCLNKVSIVRSEWPAELKAILIAQLKHCLGDSCRVLTDERVVEELDGYTTP